MIKNLKSFLVDYTVFKELIEPIGEVLESYILELGTHINKFDEFLAEYSFKVSATVHNVFEDNREKIQSLLFDLDQLIEENKEFKDFKEHINVIRQALADLDILYHQGSVEEDELKDLLHDIKTPIEDMDDIIKYEGWG